MPAQLLLAFKRYIPWTSRDTSACAVCSCLCDCQQVWQLEELLNEEPAHERLNTCLQLIKVR